MRIRHDSWTGRVVWSLAGWVIRRVISGFGRTWRITVVEGDAHVEALARRGEPVIVVVWHNRIFMSVPFLKNRLHEKGLRIAVLTSASRDGELVARTLRPWGVHAVRGSSTRGGVEAVRGTLSTLADLGASPVVVPDGPQGPPYAYKAGVVHLARLSGAPLVAMGFAADRYWTVGSWDRLMIPRPFARVSVVVGSPRRVPRVLSEDEAEAERVDQESLLNHVNRVAERSVGAPGSLPLPEDGPPAP